MDVEYDKVCDKTSDLFFFPVILAEVCHFDPEVAGRLANSSDRRQQLSALPNLLELFQLDPKFSSDSDTNGSIKLRCKSKYAYKDLNKTSVVHRMHLSTATSTAIQKSKPSFLNSSRLMSRFTSPTRSLRCCVGQSDSCEQWHTGTEQGKRTIIPNVLRSVVKSCSLRSPVESCNARALRKCSAASLCAPMFRPDR